MYTRWASAPPSAWRSWAATMLAGSLLAAIAEARAWRSMCGWAANPTLEARRAKARLAWLGLTGVPRSVRNTRSSSTGRGGQPGCDESDDPDLEVFYRHFWSAWCSHPDRSGDQESVTTLSGRPGRPTSHRGQPGPGQRNFEVMAFLEHGLDGEVDRGQTRSA
jgi:hypothetical protein